MPSPCVDGDDQRLAESELVQLLGGAHGGRVVDLVGDEHDGDAPTAQHLGDLEIVGQRAGAAVDHEEHDVGRVDGQLDLLADVPGERRLLRGVVAAGVDHAHQAAFPLDLDVLAVASHARRLVHHSLTRTAQAVHEGGLAGVRRADDDDGGRGTHPDSVANAWRSRVGEDQAAAAGGRHLVLAEVVQGAPELGRQEDARGDEPLAGGERVVAERVEHLAPAEQAR